MESTTLTSIAWLTAASFFPMAGYALIRYVESEASIQNRITASDEKAQEYMAIADRLDREFDYVLEAEEYPEED
jgi:hypothetical protein